MAVEWKVGDFLSDRGLNRFEIKYIIPGGMGNILVVYDHKLKEVFAAKTIRNEIIMRNREFYSNLFEQEALTWVNLDIHPNVAQARSFNYVGSTPVLFLEYVSGGDLNNWIGTHRLMKDIPQILSFAIQFCDGMIYVLSNGIKAHRDIKPQNCLVTSDRVLKVTDFGLARIEQERYGVGGGTPEYMAPEQWNSPKQANVQSDIYSFGAMLFAMLSGKPPFGQRPHIQSDELERKHKEETPKIIDLTFQRIKRAHRRKLNEILISCLAKKPGERYENFLHIRKQLGKLYKSLTGQSPPNPIAGIKLGAEEWQNKGLSLGHLGYYKEEIACCDKAIALAPGWSNPWATKAAAFIALERFTDAHECAECATKINPNHELGWNNKGVALSHLGQYEDAIKCFDVALKINPYYDKALENKGAALLNLGKYEDAISEFDKAIEIMPTNYDAFINKASALIELKRYEEAASCSVRAIDINPNSGGAWYIKGLALTKSFKNIHEALKSFEESHRLGFSKAQPLIDICRQLLEAEHPQASSNNPGEWFDFGIAWKEKGLFENAINCFDRALEFDPNFDNALRVKGNALDELGRYEDAISCYNLALELNVKNEHTWYDKGVVLFKLKMYEDALSCFSKAVEINSQNIQAWTNMATTLSTLGRFNDAINCCEQAISINSKYETAWYNKGCALHHLGELDEALECYNKAIQIRPTYAKAWYYKGSILANSGYIEEGMKCFLEALRLGHPDAEQAMLNCRRAFNIHSNNH